MEIHGVDDDEVKGGKAMMLRMLMLRARKMMILRRRRTDLKTGTRTLCEFAQLKCTWMIHKDHNFAREISGKMRWSTLIKQPACTLTIRTSQHGHAFWGTKTSKYKTC